MSWLSGWWNKWIGHSADDWRNFGWRITEALRVKVEWSKVIFDLRIGFKNGGSWQALLLKLWTPVEQNFWNGILTANLYLTLFYLWKIPILTPRVGLVIRFAYDWYFQFGVGILFDRGEFGFKLRIAKMEPGDAPGWDEGSV